LQDHLYSCYEAAFNFLDTLLEPKELEQKKAAHGKGEEKPCAAKRSPEGGRVLQFMGLLQG
jgi:hypothetical protein